MNFSSSLTLLIFVLFWNYMHRNINTQLIKWLHASWGYNGIFQHISTICTDSTGVTGVSINQDIYHFFLWDIHIFSYSHFVMHSILQIARLTVVVWMRCSPINLCLLNTSSPADDCLGRIWKSVLVGRGKMYHHGWLKSSQTSCHTQ